MTRTTGVIFSPVLGRTFFLPGFGASSLTEVDEELELDVDVELDVEPELDEVDEVDEELELDEDDELDEELELDDELELDEVLVGFVLSHLTLLQILILIALHGLNYAVLGNWLPSMLACYGQYHRL